MVTIYNAWAQTVEPRVQAIHRDDFRYAPGHASDLLYCRREAVTQTLATPDANFDHSQERAVPIGTLTWQFRHRCCKCRAIYNYNIIQGVEGVGRQYYRDPHWPGTRNCAEVLAHALCSTYDEDNAEAGEEEEDWEDMEKDGLEGKEKKDNVERGSTYFTCFLQIPVHHHLGIYSPILSLEEGYGIQAFSRYPCLVQQIRLAKPMKRALLRELTRRKEIATHKKMRNSDDSLSKPVYLRVRKDSVFPITLEQCLV